MPVRASTKMHEKHVYPVPPTSRMWALNEPEMGYIVLGWLGAVVRVGPISDDSKPDSVP